MTSETREKLTLLILGLTSFLLIVSGLELRSIREKLDRPIEGSRDLAAALAARGLYREAAAAVEQALGGSTLSPGDRAALLRFRAEMWLSEGADAQAALADLTRAAMLDPAGKSDDDKKAAAALARLGRLRESTLLSQRAGTVPVELPSTPVAKIGAIVVTLQRLYREIDRTPRALAPDTATKTGRRGFLETLILKELLTRLAEARGLDSDPKIADQFDRFRKERLTQAVLEKDVFAALSVDEQAIRYFYEANRQRMIEPSRYTVSALALQDGTTAASIVSSSDPKATFLTSRNRPDATLRMDKDTPLPVNEISNQTGVDPALLEAALSKSGVGLVSGPFKDASGSHVVFLLNAVVPGRAVPLEEARPEIEKHLLAEKQRERLQAYILKLFAEHQVQIFDEALGPDDARGTPAPGAPTNK